MTTWWRPFALPLLTAFCAAVIASCGSGSSPSGLTVVPTATGSAPPTPAGTATPPYEGSLHAGDWARVAGAGDCLNFRASDSTESRVPINFCRADGFEGYVSDGPRLNEGHWWWWIAGQGWAQDDYLEYASSEDLSKRTVPELSGLGQIAYLGADGIWIMNSDGRDKRRLVDAPAPGSSTAYHSLVWRPDGQQLAFSSTVYAASTTSYEVRIVDLKGEVVKVVPDATSAFWSSDGKRLGLLHEILRNEVGSIEATPSVYDIATGAITPIGPLAFYGEGPKWRPGADELVYSGREGLILAQADGSGTRLLSPAPNGGASHMPNWSPDGSALTVNIYFDDCQGYAIIDAEDAEVALCAPVRPGDPNRGGRGGTAEDRQTDWSPDGRLFAYHTEWGVANESGVYVVDASTGEQTLLPGWAPASTSFAPNSRHVVFATHGAAEGSFIWVGDATTGDVTLLAEGSQPAWRPAN
jgi:Tol biopolymer transport system component